MKLRRFCSLFFIAVLLCSQFLTSTAYAIEKMDVDAKAALLMDLDSGTVLYEQNAHKELPPASLTKVMTALLVLEAIDRGDLSLDQVITASASALAGLPEDGSNADPAIAVGEQMTVEDLLYCMLVVSANETCNILGETISGSVSAFVDAMNQRARELGCQNTHFANTNGLTDPTHYSSAYDIWLITREAMQNEQFRYICSATWKNIPATNKCDHVRALHTTNSLLDGWRYAGYQYAYATGIKTGTTEAAGHCLVASASKGSRNLISVVLGAQVAPDGKGGTDIMSFRETQRLFDWGFENFTTKVVLGEEDLIQEVPVALSKETNYVVVHPAYTATAVLPIDVEPEQLDRSISLYADVANAPITAGDELGSITLSYNGVDYTTVPLLAMTDVTASRFLTVKYEIEHFFSLKPVKIALLVLILLIIAFVAWWKMFHRQRRYGRSKDRRYRRRSYRGRRF